MIHPLGCCLNFLTLLLGERFGFDDRLLQRCDAGFQLRDLLGRCLGILRSLLAEGLGLGECFLQSSGA